jgi:hypothetical protein
MKRLGYACFVDQAYCFIKLLASADFCWLDTWLDLGYDMLVVNKFPFCNFEIVPSKGQCGGLILSWYGNILQFIMFILLGLYFLPFCPIVAIENVYNPNSFESLANGSSCLVIRVCYHNLFMVGRPNTIFTSYFIVPPLRQLALKDCWIIIFIPILGYGKHFYDQFKYQFIFKVQGLSKLNNVTFACSIFRGTHYPKDPSYESVTLYSYIP